LYYRLDVKVAHGGKTWLFALVANSDISSSDDFIAVCNRASSTTKRGLVARPTPKRRAIGFS